jgi:hypothetical protein
MTGQGFAQSFPQVDGGLGHVSEATGNTKSSNDTWSFPQVDEGLGHVSAANGNNNSSNDEWLALEAATHS